MALKPETATELRGMVRDLLREALAGRTAKAGVEAVKIGNDAELAAFVARLIEPATLEAVRTGKLRFTLAGSAPSPTAVATPAAAVPAAPVNMLDGVITEHKLNGLAGAGTVILAPGAVLTPLARDRARQLGLRIERRR